MKAKRINAKRFNRRPDRVTPETRSRIMSAIRSTGNRSTERRLRAALVSSGTSRWRMHAAELPGTPDFVFGESNLTVFVDGCFWHGCPKCYRRPYSSREYWDMKVARNKARDLRKRSLLRKMGWIVIRFWEHEVCSDPSKCVSKIRKQLSEPGHISA